MKGLPFAVEEGPQVVYPPGNAAGYDVQDYIEEQELYHEFPEEGKPPVCRLSTIRLGDADSHNLLSRRLTSAQDQNPPDNIPNHQQQG